MAVGSLDNPEIVTPAFHFGVESKVSWYTIPDDLPQRRADVDPGLRAHRNAVSPKRQLSSPEEFKPTRHYDTAESHARIHGASVGPERPDLML